MSAKMPVELDNEIALVRLAQSGSIESFGILVKRYERHVYRLVRAVTTDDDDAEDLLELTFLKAYETLGGFKEEVRFYTWLARIAINEAVTKLRRRHAFTWDSFDEHVDRADALSTPGNVQEWSHSSGYGYSKAELSTILSKALEDMETPLRIIFALREMEGFSLKETANVLGLSVPVVKTSWMHALLKLRSNLSIWFEGRPVPASK